MKNNKIKGISLIVLIVTIIVIVILAGTVILSLAENNTIGTANEAVFKNDISTMQEQLNSYLTAQLSETSGTFDINTMTGNLSTFVTDATKYDEELEVVEGKLVYTGEDVDKTKISLEMGIIPEVVTVSGITFNKPNISYLPESTTKAVKWDANNIESEIDLALAKNDTSWYDYVPKKWANIKTSNNGNVAYWVWIPRYAYKYAADYSIVDIKFLVGSSDITTEGTILPEDYYIYDAFTFGDKELSGIWIAKYEASSSAQDVKEGTIGYTSGGNNTALHVRVLPSVYSWRNISTGNAQTVSMNMTSSTGSVGTTLNVDTHQMKSQERGAVTLLTKYIYGQKPWINPYGDSTSGLYKLKTGYSGETSNSGALAEGSILLHPYNDLVYGVNASTTGNIYGVYDLLGGSWEQTAGLYDSGDSCISTYGKAEHILSNKVKLEYEKYYYLIDGSLSPDTGIAWQMVGGAYNNGANNFYNTWATFNGNKSTNTGFRPVLICGLGL